MLKRILSILTIMLLLGVSGLPYISWSGNPEFVYATEELTQEETLKAGIAAYLNKRGGYIVSTASSPIDTVQNVMQTWINSYEFWKNTNVGSLADVYANIIITYSPFRVSLKGPAIRAFNDLYDWLVNTGKLGNLQNSQGGETTDSLYSGLEYSGQLFYIVNGSPSNVGLTRYNANNVQIGSPVHGVTSETLMDYALSQNSMTVQQFINNNSSYRQKTYTMQYFADRSVTFYLDRLVYYSDVSTRNYRPCLYLNNGLNDGNEAQLGSAIIKSFGNYTLLGNPAYIHYTGNNKNYIGFACVDYTQKYIGVFNLGEISSNNNYGITNTNANFVTNDFEKTNPDPPDDDEEVTYTPQVKETSGNYTAGDTFNTYNEYITNYVNENTVINNNYTEPEQETPGGTTPPWTDNGSSGTLIPDGNGGYDLSLPDLTLPDLDIDWSINGLKDKFPFSIPWDLMAFFTVMNAEPETPAIEGDIDLGIVDWEIDWDLHNFDTLAALLRNLEFIGFCIGLILITRNIIKG